MLSLPSFVFRARPCHLLGEFIKDCSDGLLLFLKALLFFSELLQHQCRESGLLPPSGQMVTLATASVTRKSYFALNQAEIFFFHGDTVSPPLALLELLCVGFAELQVSDNGCYHTVDFFNKIKPEFGTSPANQLTAIITNCITQHLINSASALIFALCSHGAVCQLLDLLESTSTALTSTHLLLLCYFFHFWTWSTTTYWFLNRWLNHPVWHRRCLNMSGDVKPGLAVCTT